MAGRNPDRLIDKTHLSIDTAEERGMIHRDYIAHCLRWSHVAKFMQSRYRTAVVLDVGCGRELPLAKTLYSNRLIPLHYVGVDANKLQIPDMLLGKKFPITVWSESDFCSLLDEDVWYRADDGLRQKPNVLTCLEVLEHVPPGHCRRMLRHMQEVTSDDCDYFISTPCWNGSAAENHVNEMTFGALGSLLEDLGFEVRTVNGTFASIRDYGDQLSRWTYYYSDESTVPPQNKIAREADLRPVFEALSAYYDTNVLAVVFAPLFPAHSRNCLWHLRKGGAGIRKFSRLQDAVQPWSQHPKYLELMDPDELKASPWLGHQVGKNWRELGG